MTWVLAFVGFCVLIVLHEAGHFAAAKAVGMRVERFSLFFGRPLLAFRRGETEYGVGWLPLGGYVRISGMNPREELPPEVVPRSYYKQPVWKRVVVIAAGPAVNIVLAFVLLWGVFMINGEYEPTRTVSSAQLEQPATRYLQPGDRIVSVDGVSGGQAAILRQVASHRCAGRPVDGCTATTAAQVVVLRDGQRLTFDIRPRYDARRDVSRARLGFTYTTRHVTYGPVAAADVSLDRMWALTKGTGQVFARIFDAQERRKLGGIVGGYEVTRQSFGFSAAQALYILGLISLSLALINLLPFLPLDGGHIFWALAEKVRGRPIPFSIMERASAVGFVLVIMLFVIGLTNDIERLQNGGFGVR